MKRRKDATAPFFAWQIKDDFAAGRGSILLSAGSDKITRLAADGSLTENTPSFFAMGVINFEYR